MLRLAYTHPVQVVVILVVICAVMTACVNFRHMRFIPFIFARAIRVFDSMIHRLADAAAACPR